MKLVLSNLTRGDAVVLFMYIFSAVAGLIVFTMGLGYSGADRLIFGIITAVCIVFMTAYELLCGVIQ
jgi:hypothetical protein